MTALPYRIEIRDISSGTFEEIENGTVVLRVVLLCLQGLLEKRQGGWPDGQASVFERTFHGNLRKWRIEGQVDVPLVFQVLDFSVSAETEDVAVQPDIGEFRAIALEQKPDVA